MTDQQSEWVTTPEVVGAGDSEWTAEPLPALSQARRDSRWKGVSEAMGGVSALGGLVFIGMYLVGRFAHTEATDASHPANAAPAVPKVSSSQATSTPTAAPAKPAGPTHWASSSSPGLPQIDLTLASGPVPSTLKVGSPITIDLEAVCLALGDEDPYAVDGMARGGISVSVLGDASLSSLSPGAVQYPPGSMITCYDKRVGWISDQRASNDLIEKTASPWIKGQKISLSVIVTPVKPGELTLSVRSTATLRKVPVSSTDGSSDLDQQGLPVQAFHMTVTE